MSPTGSTKETGAGSQGTHRQPLRGGRHPADRRSRRDLQSHPVRRGRLWSGSELESVHCITDWAQSLSRLQAALPAKWEISGELIAGEPAVPSPPWPLQPRERSLRSAMGTKALPRRSCAALSALRGRGSLENEALTAAAPAETTASSTPVTAAPSAAESSSVHTGGRVARALGRSSLGVRASSGVGVRTGLEGGESPSRLRSAQRRKC